MTDLIADLEQWCSSQRDSLTKGLKLMESGVMRTHEKHDGQIVDTTDATMRSYQDNIADLEELLAKIKSDREAKA